MSAKEHHPWHAPGGIAWQACDQPLHACGSWRYHHRGGASLQACVLVLLFVASCQLSWERSKAAELPWGQPDWSDPRWDD